MRKLFIITLFLFCGFFAQSQDYAPIRDNYTYQYLSDTVVHSFKTIKKNGDTLLFNSINNLLFIGDPTDTNNLLGRKMYKTASGYDFVHTRKDTVHVKTDGTNSWVFQKTGNIIANYLGKSQETFLGVTDSVINIHLNNGRNLKISKNYGLILTYPFFNSTTDSLVIDAIPEAKLGKSISSPFTYWGEYNVGDVLGTTYKYLRCVDGFCYHWSSYEELTQRRIEITKVFFSENSDTLYYEANILTTKTTSTSTSVNQVKDKITFKVYEGFRSDLMFLTDFVKTPNDMLTENQPYFDVINYQNFLKFDDKKFKNDYHFKGKDGKYVVQHFDSNEYDNYIVLKEAIGITDYYWHLFEGLYYTGGTKCYIKNGIKYGDCADYDQMLLVASAIDESFAENQVKAYPNPAKGVLQFTNADKIERLTFVNSIGAAIVLPVNGENLDISSLQAGLYILKMQSKNGDIVNQKLIIE